MNQLAALWYLDASRMRNALVNLIRKPSRLWLWIFFVLWFGLTSWLRTGRTRSLFPDLGEPYATLVAGISIALLGFLLANAASLGRVNAFSDPVDAYFLSRSSLSEPLVSFWLQARNFAITFGRFGILLLVGVTYYAHGHIAGSAFALIGVVTLTEALRMPVALLARHARWLKFPFFALGAVGAALAFSAVGALAWPSLANAQTIALGLGFGRVVLMLWHGSPAALFGLYGCALAALVLGVAASGDIYPEMYSSARFIEAARTRLRRGGNISIPVSTGTSRSASTSLHGPWVEIWKQVAFIRRRNGAQLIFMGLASAIVVGIVAGFAARRDPSLGISIGSTVLLMIVIVLALRSVSLASDLSKPLWWMGDGSAFTKLLAWTIGSSLPAVALLTLAAAIAGAIADPQSLSILLLIAVGVPLSTRAIGIFTYMLMPSAVDQRGPGNAVRMLLIYALLIPAVAGGVACAIFSNNAGNGFFAGLFIYLGESALALAFAARRIAGRGVEFALAESS